MGQHFFVFVLELVLTVTEESNVRFPTLYKSCVTAHAINSQCLTEEAWIHSHCCPYGRVVLDGMTQRQFCLQTPGFFYASCSSVFLGLDSGRVGGHSSTDSSTDSSTRK
jgi:hypothetical protein